jgi:hypothetical protein
VVANCVFFIVAGHETTSTLIAAGADLLCHHPAQRAALAADQSRWSAAVEEMLRYVSPTTFTGARARVDVEVEGERFEARSQRLMFYAAANHDPGVFPDPDRFDITRSTKGHVAFSAGHTTAWELRWRAWKPRSGCPPCSAASRLWPPASPSGVGAPHSGRSSPCPARGELPRPERPHTKSHGYAPRVVRPRGRTGSAPARGRTVGGHRHASSASRVPGADHPDQGGPQYARRRSP